MIENWLREYVGRHQQVIQAIDLKAVEEVIAQASPGDLLIAISVSGNSPNVVRAAEYARSHGMVTVGLVGSPGGRLAELADHPVVIGTGHFGHCEDAHMFIAHLIGYAFIDNPGL